MILVSLQKNVFGELVFAASRGHSEAVKTGVDPVCTAVSLLFYAVSAGFFDVPGLTLDVSAPEKGDFSLRVLDSRASLKELLKFSYDFLLKGFRKLESSFPENLKLELLPVVKTVF